MGQMHNIYGTAGTPAEPYPHPGGPRGIGARSSIRYSNNSNGIQELVNQSTRKSVDNLAMARESMKSMR